MNILAISGSARAKSVNAAVLRTARHVAPSGTVVAVNDVLRNLPHFNPDDDADPLPPAVGALRSAIRHADALLFSTPEYAGALPGSFKNLLDWTIGDDQTGSINEKPVGWINPSVRGAVDAHESLRKVLGYANAFLVDGACVNLPVAPALVGDDGLIADVVVREKIAEVLNAFTSAARPHRNA
jgi:NAD(P)H-dependent FMN reductase